MSAGKIDDIIRDRHSTRTFDGSPLRPEDRAAMAEYLDGGIEDHRGGRVRLSLADRDATSMSGEKLGTYGVIRGARLFLVGSHAAADPFIEAFGFAFEKAILRATEIGLGSCWLAGSLDRRSFGAALGLSERDLLPAVSPLGYSAGKRSLIENIIRMQAGSASRKTQAELFFSPDGKSPLRKEDAGRYALPLDAVRLAPSASNKQPWRLARTERGFRFFIKRTPGYGAIFGYDLQRMDLGIAMCHFQLSALASGLKGRWEYEKAIEPLPESAEYLVSWVEE